MDKLRKKSHTDGDAQVAMMWMNMRGIDYELFCYRYSLDEEGKLANLFWRDHQSLLDYKAYSNVLIIDTTYKTNLYRKPLVDFVECNNHRATVVFGFALIRDKKEDTTQGVEGMHSKLKSDLDRYTLISKMMPRMERSISRIWDRIPGKSGKGKLEKSVGDSTMAPCFKVPIDNKAAQVARVGMNELARLVQSSIKFRVNPPVVGASNLPPSNVVRDPQIARTKGMHDNPSTGTETSREIMATVTFRVIIGAHARTAQDQTRSRSGLRVFCPSDVFRIFAIETCSGMLDLKSSRGRCCSIAKFRGKDSHDDDAGEKFAEMYDQLQLMGSDAAEA
ncbi:hypothetical protein ACLB2K_041923 [Fragaria x ananassa]